MNQWYSRIIALQSRRAKAKDRTTIGAKGWRSAISPATSPDRGVHKRAAAALAAQVGIVHRRPFLLGVEAASEQGIGPELRWTAIELAGMAKDHAGPAVHGLHDAANLHVGVAIFLQLADIGAVFLKADNGEAALLVRGLRRADVEEPRAIWKLHHIIDMRGNANVFVEHLRRLVGGDARLGFGGKRERRRANGDHRQTGGRA